MKSVITDDFRDAFARLPPAVQEAARKAYRLWRDDPQHPGVRFKPVAAALRVFSARIGLGWRAHCVVEDDVAIWFWVGSHADYDRLLGR